MAGATTTTLSTAIKKTFDTMVDNLDYQGTPLRSLLGPPIPSLGGNSYDWKVHYGGNSSSTTFSEGDAVSAAGNESYADATLASSTGYARTMVQITGHAIDAMKNGYFDGVSMELEKAINSHMHYKEDLAVTALEAAIDSAGSYAGLLRSTYKLASYEAAVGTLALSDLQTMEETQASVEIAADLSGFIYAATMAMINEYLDVAAFVQYGEYNQVRGEAVDAGKLIKLPEYNGRPWRDIPTMTATTILFFNPADIKLVEFRGLQIDELAKNDDSNTYAITSAEILVDTNPKMHGKLT